MQVNSYSQNNAYNFNIFYLFFVVLWPLLQGTYFRSFDAAGRIGWLMMAMAVVVNGRNFFRVSHSMMIWGGWILYNIILSQVKGYYSENVSFVIFAINSLLKPFVSMFVAYHAIRGNESKTIKLMLLCWMFFVVIGLLAMDTATKSLDTVDVVRQSNVLGNAFVNASIFLLTFAFYALYKGSISKKLFIFACVLEVIAVLLSGSRKGILSIIVIFFMSYVGRNPEMGMKQFVRIGILSLVAYVALQLVMTYTVAGLRMQHGQEISEYSDNWFLSMMGDRGWMYYYGWKMFLEQPMTGIGLGNFRWDNPMGSLYALHTEYMVQICECGIIGFSLFLLFYFGMAKRIRILLKYPNERPIAFVLLASFSALLLMNFVAWIYSFAYFFIFFGFIYAIYDNNKKLAK